MSYEFLQQEVVEARLFRNNTKLDGVSQKELALGFFALALSLQVMRFEKPKQAQRYAKKTLSQGLDGWRSTGTDMNNLAQVFLQKNLYKDRIKQDSPSSAIPKMQLLGWLRDVANGRTNSDTDRRFLQALERRLLIKDSTMKSARIQAQDWERALPRERAVTLAKIDQTLQKTVLNSDLHGDFEKTKSKSYRSTGKDLKPVKKKGIPTWVKLAAAGAGLYALGRHFNKK